MNTSSHAIGSLLRWRWLPHVMGVCLFGYAAIRVHSLGLTYDEICALPFIREFEWGGITHTAQVHLLNAWLLHFITPTWGEAEAVVRLPSLLSMVIYLWAAIAISSRLPYPFGLVRFILLTMVPFVVDFFSLSRGYGEGLALMLAAILWAVRFQQHGRYSHALLALVFSALSVIASYTQLNTFLAITLLLTWRILDDASQVRTRILRAIGTGTLAGGFLTWLLPVLFELRDKGEFYFGGRTGFWTDTVGSLARCFAYFRGFDGLLPDLFKIVFAVAVVIGVGQVLKGVRKGPRGDAFIFGMILLITICSPIVQFLWLGTNLPVERTALFYFPVIALSLTQWLASWKYIRSPRIALLIGAAFAIHFLATMNLTHVYSWRFDAGSRAAIRHIQQEETEALRLGADYVHMPSLNYQKDQLGAKVDVVEISGCWNTCLGLEELAPAYFGCECVHRHFERDALLSLLQEGIDVYYLDRMMVNELDRNEIRYTVLENYPDSRSSLVRLDR